MTFIFRTFFLSVISAILFHATVLHAESLQFDEHHIKPAIVFNIARYVIWPTTSAANNASFIIGIYGHSPKGSEWRSLQGKTLQGEKILVKQITDLDELTDCRLVVIETSERSQLPAILEVLKGQPVLTVSDIEGFANKGGMIALHIINNRMTFDINLKSANSSELAISSNLLKLADKVIK